VRRWLGWAASLLLVAGVAGYYVWMGAYALARDLALAGDGPVADATVVGWTRGKGTSVFSITVDYAAAGGRRVRATVYEFRDPPPRVGTTIPVRYNAGAPDWFVRDATQSATVWKPALFLPLGLVFGACAYGVYRIRPRRDARGG
jgi:hypothetical protein